MIHDTRVIPIGTAAHVGTAIRGYNGDARGRWEGNTLVVDSTNFSEKTNFRGSRETLHIIERFTRDGDGIALRGDGGRSDGVDEAVDGGAHAGEAARRLAVRVRVPRGQQLDAEYPERVESSRESEVTSYRRRAGSFRTGASSRLDAGSLQAGPALPACYCAELETALPSTVYVKNPIIISSHV